MSKKTKAWPSKSFKVESKQETKGVQERSWAIKIPGWGNSSSFKQSIQRNWK